MEFFRGIFTYHKGILRGRNDNYTKPMQKALDAYAKGYTKNTFILAHRAGVSRATFYKHLARLGLRRKRSDQPDLFD